MYKVTRKNGSFKGRKRHLTFPTYSAARTYLRTYLRSVLGSWGRSEHPPMWLAKQRGLTISKMSS